jgi:hypothetical protein
MPARRELTMRQLRQMLRLHPHGVDFSRVYRTAPVSPFRKRCRLIPAIGLWIGTNTAIQGGSDMMVEFFDQQDATNPLNGATLTTEVELSTLVEGLRSRPPFFCEFVGENGFKLLVGVGRDVGCVEHSSCDGDPPYLMATTNSVFNLNDCVRFLTGNEPTPVPRYYCLPMELVKQIANYFVETGERSVNVRWEEI